MTNILLVDDRPDFRHMFTLMLQMDNAATVTAAESGAKALEHFENAHRYGDPYDLVILDQMMPEMDGIQTAACMRAFESGRHIVPGVPIAFLSARLGQLSEDDIERLGIVGVWPKPIGVAELRVQVGMVLNGSLSVDRRSAVAES